MIADDDETRFERRRGETISVPSVHPSLAFVLCALAGHLFGYEAALAIDASARPLREARGCIEALVGSAAATDGDPLVALVADLEPLAARFFAGLRDGNYDGSLEARTAVQLASMLRYALGVVPLDAYQVDFGKVGTPSVVVEDLTAALTKAIEELTRPVDAIKHQAKTVTVGISRSDETLLQVPLVREVLATGTRARQPHLPRAAHAGRARRARSTPSPGGRATASKVIPRAARRPCTSSTAAASPATSRRAPSTTRCCAVRSTASRASARSRSRAAAPTGAR